MDSSIVDVVPLLAQLGVPAQMLSTFVALSGVLGLGCSLVDAVVPQPAVGSPWVPLRKMISLLACNYRHARNAVTAGQAVTAVAGTLSDDLQKGITKTD